MRCVKLLALLSICLFAVTSCYGDGRIITFEQLPQNAKTVIKQHFSQKTPLVVKEDWDDYEVIFESGEKIEFNKKGEWKEFDCRISTVPTELVPQQILTQVNASYPGATVIKLKKDRRGYEIKLSNGLEIEFNRNFAIVDIDD